MSIPGVFCPVERDGKVLVDGGLVNPLPIEVCRQLGADKVIAVDLNCRGLDEPTKACGALNVFSVIDETFRVVMNIAQKRYFPVPTPDIVLQPPVPRTIERCFIIRAGRAIMPRKLRGCDH